MEEQFNRTLEILKKQKNNIILELEKPENISITDKLIEQLYKIDEKIKVYFKELETNKEIE